MKYTYLYFGIGSVIVIIGTFLIFQSELNNAHIAIQSGTLSGNVFAFGGPACDPRDPSCNHLLSPHYAVKVYAVDGTTIVGTTFSDANGHYSIQLPAGKYVLYTIKQTNQVSIISGQNTVFDILYDNGNR
ncbi:MAG: carboxypeptidase-like regulatory domain-containing protein [Nitrosopumilaceae archaeon]